MLAVNPPFALILPQIWAPIPHPGHGGEGQVGMARGRQSTSQTWRCARTEQRSHSLRSCWTHFGSLRTLWRQSGRWWIAILHCTHTPREPIQRNLWRTGAWHTHTMHVHWIRFISCCLLLTCPGATSAGIRCYGHALFMDYTLHVWGMGVGHYILHVWGIGAPFI